MCGIFGILKKPLSPPAPSRKIIDQLFVLSESRGKEASGFFVVSEKGSDLCKSARPASEFIKSELYQKVLDPHFDARDFLALIAHSRLATHGTALDEQNNQPVEYGGVVAVHNGILTNFTEVWDKFELGPRNSNLDSLLLPRLYQKLVKTESSAIAAIQKMTQELRGTYSVAMIDLNLASLFLFTNNGSLYFMEHDEEGGFLFASEKGYLSNAFSSGKKEPQKAILNQVYQFKITDKTLEMFSSHSLGPSTSAPQHFPEVLSRSADNKILAIEFASLVDAAKQLKRCASCILPETIPFIEFDAEGVCTYCRHHKKHVLKPFSQLVSQLENTKDCLVAFSGGRDSSYGLHVLKKELGLNVVAYSYDWGMLTDLGRRNQARMCGELGIEHILVSADIYKKRKNIQKNVLAWLKSPHPGTIPLFMAGDKQYFYYANKIREQLLLDTTVLCENYLEKTDFKSGFCGIKPNLSENSVYKLSHSKKLKMISFYMKEYLGNLSYLNSSLLDTFGAFNSYYVMNHRLVSLFDYVPWNENSINEVLIQQYDWECAPDSASTWRIGDGTTAFYNYLYFYLAGFTEHDTFRSNQIREGQITRDEAETLLFRDNQLRIDSMLWYFNTISLDMYEVLKEFRKTPHFAKKRARA